MKIIVYYFLAFITLTLSTVTLYFNSQISYLRSKLLQKSPVISNSPTPTITPTSTAIKPISINANCDLIKINSTKTSFCLNQSLIKDYSVQIIDRREEKINQANEIMVIIQTKNYKTSGELIPGSNSWRNYKVASGIHITFTEKFNSRFKNFKELSDRYSQPFFEPHDEFPPTRGGKVAKTGSLDYISELKIKDKESLSKGYEVETHFFRADRDYDLMITASPNSINEKDFMDLHEYILKTFLFAK